MNIPHTIFTPSPHHPDTTPAQPLHAHTTHTQPSHNTHTTLTQPLHNPYSTLSQTLHNSYNAPTKPCNTLTTPPQTLSKQHPSQIFATQLQHPSCTPFPGFAHPSHTPLHPHCILAAPSSHSHASHTPSTRIIPFSEHLPSAFSTPDTQHIYNTLATRLQRSYEPPQHLQQDPCNNLTTRPKHLHNNPHNTSTTHLLHVYIILRTLYHTLTSPLRKVFLTPLPPPPHIRTTQQQQAFCTPSTQFAHASHTPLHPHYIPAAPLPHTHKPRRHRAHAHCRLPIHVHIFNVLLSQKLPHFLHSDPHPLHACSPLTHPGYIVKKPHLSHLFHPDCHHPMTTPSTELGLRPFRKGGFEGVSKPLRSPKPLSKPPFEATLQPLSHPPTRPVPDSPLPFPPGSLRGERGSPGVSCPKGRPKRVTWSGPRSVGSPKYLVLFLLSRLYFHSFFLSGGLVEFWWCFEAPGPSNVHVWSSRVVVWASMGGFKGEEGLRSN